jgi:tripartite-type tricarboxylate transporter receptor subunit TctC
MRMRDRLRRTVWCLAAVAAVAIGIATPACAEYPERPVRIFTPFPPGGAVDIVARLLAAHLTLDFGRPFLVESKAGAGGILATDAVAKASADGYTLLLTTPNHTINAALNPKLPYDTERDLVPVTMVAEIPEVLVSHPAAPFTDFAGFVDYARQHPGKLDYASAGIGTLPHVSMELMLRRLGLKVTHVPYKGAAPAMTDLLAGQVQLKMDTYATSTQYVDAGKLRALAIASRKRSALMPDLPTVAEQGLPGYEGILWIGLMAPAGTPKPVIDKLAAASARAIRALDMVERFRHDGIDPGGDTGAAFSARISGEIAQWRDLIKATGIKAE